MRHPWLAAFFAFGTTMCALTIILLLFPGTGLDSLWRMNPEAQKAFRSLGNWSVALMFVVGAGCAFAAVGLWRGAGWGARLAIVILSINIAGDVMNVIVRGDYRALIGLPIGALMIYYLVTTHSRSRQISAVLGKR